MKKIILTVLVATAMLMATACSTTPEPVGDVVTSDEATIVETEVTEGEAGVSMFGKVKSIVGNEIELEVAELPFDMEAGVDGGGDAFAGEYETKEFVYEVAEGEAPPEGLEGLMVEGEAGSQSTTVIAVQGEDGEMQIIGGGDGEKMDLTYTGETKSIIIPAGTEILNMIGGSGTLDDIKKGSVLMLGVDDDTIDSPKAMNILIME